MVKKSWLIPAFIVTTTKNCTEAEDVNTTTRIAGIANWYEKPQVCIERTKIGH